MYNPDKSLTLYLQASDPGPDKQANWLPVNASGTFRLAMRAHAPTEIMIKSLIDPSVFPPAPVVKASAAGMIMCSPRGRRLLS